MVSEMSVTRRGERGVEVSAARAADEDAAAIKN